MTHDVQYENHTWVTELMEVYVLEALMLASSNIVLEARHVRSAVPNVTEL